MFRAPGPGEFNPYAPNLPQLDKYGGMTREQIAAKYGSVPSDFPGGDLTPMPRGGTDRAVGQDQISYMGGSPTFDESNPFAKGEPAPGTMPGNMIPTPRGGGRFPGGFNPFMQQGGFGGGQQYGFGGYGGYSPFMLGGMGGFGGGYNPYMGGLGGLFGGMGGQGFGYNPMMGGFGGYGGFTPMGGGYGGFGGMGGYGGGYGGYGGAGFGGFGGMGRYGSNPPPTAGGQLPVFTTSMGMPGGDPSQG